MPIIGVTHTNDGEVRVNRTVTVKVAIGLPLTGESNRPQRLDHFIFLRKIIRDKAIALGTFHVERGLMGGSDAD